MRAQAELDKETGLSGEVRQARPDFSAQVRAAEQKFVKTVGGSQGWSEADLNPKAPPGLSPEAAARFDKDAHRALLKRATKAVGLQRQALLLDAGLRAAAFGSGVPMDGASDAQVSVTDLSPTKAKMPAGVAADFGKRAAGAGLSVEALKAEVEDIKGGRCASGAGRGGDCAGHGGG
jgi:hypothetical protein